MKRHSPTRLAAKYLTARVELSRATEAVGAARERMLDLRDEFSRRRWLEALGRKALAEEQMERLELLICDSDTLAESLARSEDGR